MTDSSLTSSPSEAITETPASDGVATCASESKFTSGSATMATDSSTSVISHDDIATPRAVLEAPDWPAPHDSTDVMLSLPRRLFHFGPIIALFLIFYIGSVTSFFSALFMPIDTLEGALNLALFITWNYLTIKNLCFAAYAGPGYVQRNWKPPQVEDEKRLQWCAICEGFKSPRSHHCSKCKRCCMKMDHHCPWINNCVGHRNHGYFIRFLAFAILGCLHAICIQFSLIYLLVYGEWFVSGTAAYWDGVSLGLGSFFAFVIASAFSISVALTLSFLLFVQLKCVYKNETAIEEYIEDKVRHHSSITAGRRFIYPYNLGPKRNIAYVLGSLSGQVQGNGYWWPVLEGTDQYTFTEAQLALKQKKMQNARPGIVVEDFTPTRCLCFRFGCKICCTQPVIEGEMLEIRANQRVTLTRATKQWFYGYRDTDPNNKGWIPRTLVIPARQQESSAVSSEEEEEAPPLKGDKKND